MKKNVSLLTTTQYNTLHNDVCIAFGQPYFWKGLSLLGISGAEDFFVTVAELLTELSDDTNRSAIPCHKLVVTQSTEDLLVLWYSVCCAVDHHFPAMYMDLLPCHSQVKLIIQRLRWGF